MNSRHKNLAVEWISFPLSQVQISLEVIKHFFPNLPDAIFAKLQYFCELVHEKNKVLNLISRKDMDRIVEAHLLPSLAIFKQNPFPADRTVLDIGTGGGFPGLPLAIVTPNTHFTLVDSVGKKIRAVEEFAGALELKNVTCINDRVENLRKKYHFITGRAIANPDDFSSLAKPHLKPHGTIFYLTGGEIVPPKNTTIIDLFTLFDHLCCETKKLLITAMPKL
ncbi:MAG: 16S rRNA (guanine(527)-N(7))-methyltransferase RsmG [Puniceicoccales bacterium]|jgi:16S rRNA (guanine527-N7)-methyltransferase|nr:16S rRNA (guanine(527)-N(7))-methyltransferase RsmG [Puniceicoccales bacterium]